MTTPLLNRLACVGCLTSVLVACGGPTKPSETSGGSGTTFGTSGATVTSLSINVPPVGPGETVQLSATAKLSDGSTANYTDKVSWRSENPPVLTISSTGQATGKVSGEAEVVATLGGNIGAILTIIVTPAGTYRLKGQVREYGLPVSGATVAIVSGEGTGLSTLTDSAGLYRLYGVAGPIRVQVSKSGYDSVAQDLTLSTNQVLDITNLTQTDGTPPLAAAYTLTVTAAGACPALPTEARSRTYSATLTQDGPILQVTLSGSDFAFEKNHLSGRVTGQSVTFLLGDPDFSDLDDLLIIERLSPTSLLTFTGTANTTITPNGISGSFKGTFAFATSIGSRVPGQNGCFGTHQFTLTPVSP